MLRLRACSKRGGRMAEVQPPIVPESLYRYRSLSRSTDAPQEEIDFDSEKVPVLRTISPHERSDGRIYQPSVNLRGRPDYRTIVREITNSKSTIGIACFTETHEDVLMWTHYAGNYTGMCLSYSTSKLLAGLAHQVNLVRLAYTGQTSAYVPQSY